MGMIKSIPLGKLLKKCYDYKNVCLGVNPSVLLFILMLLVARTAGDWTVVGGKKYHVFKNAAMSIFEANSLCKAHNASLPEPKNGHENQALSRLDSGRFYLGIFDGLKEGLWMYLSDGKSLVWTNWRRGEPNGGNDDNCAMVLKNVLTWVDFACDLQKTSTGSVDVVCEIPHCPVGFTRFGPICYKFFPDKKTHREANDVCEAHGGFLAEPIDEEENGYAKQAIDTGYRNNDIQLPHHVEDTAATWLGGTLSWIWPNINQRVSYSDWAKGMPDDGLRNENCMQYRNDHIVGWNDAPCNLKSPFLCQSDRDFTHSEHLSTKVQESRVFKGCPVGFTRHGEYCYRFFRDEMSRIEAQNTCNHYGGFLAEPKTAQENSIVKDIINAAYFNMKQPFLFNNKPEVHAWLGGESVWFWPNISQPVSYYAWGTDELFISPTGRCLQQRDDHIVGWTNAHCDIEVPFLCQASRAQTCDERFTYCFTAIGVTGSSLPPDEDAKTNKNGFCRQLVPLKSCLTKVATDCTSLYQGISQIKEKILRYVDLCIKGSVSDKASNGNIVVSRSVHIMLPLAVLLVRCVWSV